MDRLITLWQDLTVEQLVIGLLIGAIFLLFGAIKCLRTQYNQLDKLSLLMASKIDPRMVRIHRNGNYEIVHPFNNHDIPTLNNVATEE